MIVGDTGWPDLELLNAAPILVWRAGTDAACDWFNPAWLAYTGRSLDQELGNGWAEGVHPDDLQHCLDIYLHAFALREPFDMEYRLHRADGSYGWIMDYGVPIFAGSAEFLGYVGFCFDVTQRHRTEELILRREEELSASNAELEQFAYVVSHDLREPLRMISSYIALIERRYGALLDTDGHEFLGFVRDGAQRMDAMVLDILAFSRIDRRGEPLVPMALGDAITQALANLQAAIGDSGAGVWLDCSPGLLMRGDISQVERVFRNLIGNAIKYRKPAVTPDILVHARASAGTITVRIEDNGIGIEPKDYERIFLLFQRLHPHSAYEGSGIGLSVAKKIVERHGGTIRVEPSPRGGTAFVFTIPEYRPAT